MEARPTTGVVWKVVFLTTTGFWCCAQQGILSAVLQHSFRFIWRDDFHVVQNQSGLNPTLQAAGIRHVWNCAPGGARSSRNRIFAALIPHVRDAPYLTLYASGVKDWRRSFWSAVLQHRFRFD